MSPRDVPAARGSEACARGAAERVELAPPPEVRWIARKLEEAGYETWAVGGAVRDALAGLPPGDWDLTTAARPRDVQRIFRRTVPVGIDHGTVGVLGRDRKLYEVTTFRRDVETFGRHAVVAFADTLEEDLERRDFTINAVAWHPLRGELRDPHGGRADLAAGVLRTVGEPARRFAEDRLRVLRALRFAGRFDLRIEPRTWQAACEAVPELSLLSAERVREELYKLLSELRCPSVSLQLYRESGALRVLYPELQVCVGVPDADAGTDVWTHLLAVTDALPRSRATLRLAALLHDVGKPATRQHTDGGIRYPDHAGVGAALARTLLRRLKASNAETDRIVHLVAHHTGFPPATATDAEVRQWLRVVGRAFVPDLFRLRFAQARALAARRPEMRADSLALYRRVRQVLTENPPLAVAELAIGGAELRALGLRPGPRYGEILRELLDRVIADPSLNTPERLREVVRAEYL